MTDYSQPTFYRFNRDSLELVNFVRRKVLSAERILDLGAGSGIIGIELARRLKPSQLCLLELQSDFLPHLEANRKLLPDDVPVEIIQGSFSTWRPSVKFDLIVCNPPYYLPGRGEPSKDERRGIARSFIIDGWGPLLDCVDKALAERGRAFFVIKNERSIEAAVRSELLRYPFAVTFSRDGDLLFLELLRLNVK